MNGTRLGGYDPLKRKLSQWTGISTPNLPLSMISAVITGVIGSIFANPFYLAKTRMQAQSNALELQQQHQMNQYSNKTAANIGHQHHYRNSFHALREIYRKEGINGWLRGIKAACILISVASASQIPSYEFFKRQLMERTDFFRTSHPTMLHLTASCIAGFILTLTLNPFDVITTRLFNQEVVNGRPAVYNGWLNCTYKILKTEGPLGFYKGFASHYARVAPHTIMIFLLLEKLREFGDKHGIY